MQQESDEAGWRRHRLSLKLPLAAEPHLVEERKARATPGNELHGHIPFLPQDQHTWNNQKISTQDIPPSEGKSKRFQEKSLTNTKP